MKRFTFLGVLLVLALGQVALAAVPRTISYQGVLRSSSGAPIPNGNHILTLSLYTASGGGTAQWTETDTVYVSNCTFHTILGDGTTLDLPFDQAYWLGVSVDGGTEQTPRTAFTATPYAFRAIDADRAAVADSVVGGPGGDADWIIHGNDMYAGVSGMVGIGTVAPTAKLEIQVPEINGGGIRLSDPNTTIALLADGSSADEDGRLSLFHAGGDSSTSHENIRLYATRDYPSWINAGNFGIGTTSPNERLTVYGALSLDEMSAPSATSGYGKIYVKTDNKLYFKSDAGTEYDLTAAGGSGTVTSLSQGTGISCTPNPITSTGTIAFNQSWGDNRFVNEEQANCISTGMINTVGASSGEALMYNNFGSVTWGYPIADGLNLPYVASLNTNSIALDIYVTSVSDDSPAIQGTRAVQDWYGVGVQGRGGYMGVRGDALGIGNYTYYGIFGHATAGSGGTAYGVYSTTGGRGTQYAGFFDGPLYASSSHAGVEAVRIDHPLDAGNMYLQHSSVASPDMMNVYNGNVTPDGSGVAWVELPAWFETLNREFRYQLTCIGGFAPVYIAQKISGNRFQIAGGKPGIEVSWQVTGVRHDPVAEAHRVEVEMAKPVGERGKYLYPELYGMPESLGIGHSDKGTSGQ